MKIYLEELLNQFYIDFAEYVGANAPLDIDKYVTAIKPFIKQYSCYRYWSEIQDQKTLQFIQGEIKSIPIRAKKYYACTKRLENFKAMIEEDEIIGIGLISQHEGKGISALEVLKHAFSIVKDAEDLRYIQETYSRNKHQDEILFLDAIHELNEDNVVAYFNEDERMIVPL